MRGAGRGRPLRPTRPSRPRRSVARAGRSRGGDRCTRALDGGYSSAARRSSSSPCVPEHVAQLDLADVEDTQRASGGRPAAAVGRIEAHLVDPQGAVGDRDREGRAEERLEIEARPGGGDRHRLEDAPARRSPGRRTRSRAPGCRRTGRTGSRGPRPPSPRTSRPTSWSCPGSIARRTRSAWARIRSRSATSTLTPLRAAHPVAVSRRGSGRVAGVEDAAVHLETRQVG